MRSPAESAKACRFDGWKPHRCRRPHPSVANRIAQRVQELASRLLFDCEPGRSQNQGDGMATTVRAEQVATTQDDGRNPRSTTEGRLAAKATEAPPNRFARHNKIEETERLVGREPGNLGSGSSRSSSIPPARPSRESSSDGSLEPSAPACLPLSRLSAGRLAVEFVFAASRSASPIQPGSSRLPSASTRMQLNSHG